MVTAEVNYLGDLRTSCLHTRSGVEIITDAPTDNHGRGEAFSPTDLVATAYASCMITIMGIFCREHGLVFKHAKASVEKIMESNPRRIGKIVIALDLTGNGWNDKEAEKVVRAGKACPVAKTLGDNIELELTIIH
jgi:putative redox protein